MSTLSRQLLAAVLALACGTASADFITRDSSFDEDSLVVDRDTGTQYLRLDLTYNMSYNDVLANLGAGGTFEGFTWGSPAPIVQRLQFAFSGSTGPYIPPPQASVDAALPFFELMGAVPQSNGSLRLQGFVFSGGAWDPLLGIGAGESGVARDYSMFIGEHTVDYYDEDMSHFKPDQYAAVGTFLVSTSPIPEPSTYALMVIGIGIVGAAVRRRRRDRRLPAGLA